MLRHAPDVAAFTGRVPTFIDHYQGPPPQVKLIRQFAKLQLVQQLLLL